jgi:P pilus assembly chaperone PapD
MHIQSQAQRGQAQGVIEITNLGNEPYRARVSAFPFTYDDKGLKVVDTSASDLSPYLIYAPREVVIDPGQTQQVRLVARLLPSADAGEYRAVIFTEELRTAAPTPTAPTAPTAQVNIVTRIGVVMYVRQGDARSALTATAAQVDAANRTIALSVNNQGNASVRAITRWALSQNGSSVQSGEVGETTIIAGEQRNIGISYGANSPALRPGAYVLSGELASGDGTIPFSVNVTIP